jgi:hypothetical protein
MISPYSLLCREDLNVGLLSMSNVGLLFMSSAELSTQPAARLQGSQNKSAGNQNSLSGRGLPRSSIFRVTVCVGDIQDGASGYGQARELGQLNKQISAGVILLQAVPKELKIQQAFKDLLMENTEKVLLSVHPVR